MSLDARQRAMLAEMGVRPWWPAPVPPAVTPPAAAVREPEPAPLAAAVAEAPAPRPRPAPAYPAVAAVAAPAPTAVAPAPVRPADRPDVAQLDWPTLQETMRGCSACALSKGRCNVVPGVGDAERPDWLVVGEAPGEQEDLKGEPFVGAAGQLLDRMLNAMGLARGERVYITNVIKCRPPHNRNPEPDEIAQCLPFLQRQIALLRPRIVLAVGRFAAQTVLGLAGVDDAVRTGPLGKLRGQVYRLPTPDGDIPVVVSYHPAYLLRSPAEKAKAWADLCLALEHGPT
jgi:DNA polymerase